MVIDAALFSTQHYKVWTKGKVVAIEKGVFGLPFAKVVNFIFYFTYINQAS